MPAPERPAHPAHREAELPRGARPGIGCGRNGRRERCTAREVGRERNGERRMWEFGGGLEIALRWWGDVRIVREASYACVYGGSRINYFVALARKKCALLNKRHTVLPSSDPALALVVIPPPDFLWLDGGGWGPSWFDKVGIAAGQSRVAEDGRER